MTEDGLQLARSAGFLLACVIAVAMQRVSPHAAIRRSPRMNLSLWLLNTVVLGALCGACVFGAAVWASDHGVGVLNMARIPAWCAILVTLPALDLLSYGWHWANHRVGLLWRFHRVHHSDESFTASTGVRFHPGELLLSLPPRIAVVVLLGAPAIGILAFEIVFAVANLFEHSDTDLPRGLERRMERVLITPALHRFHHIRARPDLDHNFGTLFSCWDRLFGTIRWSASADRIDTGLPGRPVDPSLRQLLVLPLAPRSGTPIS